MENTQSVSHPFSPVFDESSEILILGSFPSVKSRENNFYYAHAHNRFWRVLPAVFGCTAPVTVEEKRDFLLSHHIALWDVIASCEISGSSDSTIKNVVANDLSQIFIKANIEKVFVNGKAAEKYYNKYTSPNTHKPCMCLPSTSPANAAWTIDRLISEWSRIINT